MNCQNSSERVTDNRSSEELEIGFETYKPIVYSAMKRYYLRGYDEDDWMQEGLLVFWRSQEKYDETYGLTLGSFFRMNFDRRVCSLLRYQSAEKRNFDAISSSLEEEQERHGDTRMGKSVISSEYSIDYIIFRDTLKDFGKELSSLELKVYYRLLMLQEEVEISEELGVTVGQVKNAIDRIKRKMKATL